MIYVFEDGRIVYKKDLLLPEDEGHFITLEKLPEIEPVEGKVGIITGYNLETRELIIEYFDDYVPEPIPEPPLPVEPVSEPTDTQLVMQAFSDAELRDFEAQEERKMLAQQMTDIELAVLGGGTIV